MTRGPGGGEGGSDPGTRLLPEFDALMLGYRMDGRGRFLDEASLASLWSATNGQVSPVLLHDGRIVGRWRTRPTGRGLRLEVIPFLAGHGLRAHDLEGPSADLGRVLDQPVEDVEISAPNRGPLDRVRP